MQAHTPSPPPPPPIPLKKTNLAFVLGQVHQVHNWIHTIIILHILKYAIKIHEIGTIPL